MPARSRPPRGVEAPRSVRSNGCQARVPARRWPALLALGVAVFLGVLGFGALADGMSPPVPERTTVVSVAPGETLWQVADRYAADSDPNEVVARIQQLNEMSGTKVHAGDVLTVPDQAGGTEIN
ncbi:LysM peptidoglycan-binding domain-containing protein [Tamaricihabitans halophyticus]|uniref:LysM peptidoglycan-binding domain-containing protein n=1 Tax=Tamaricihabitans halophyticus TaxID=1262583 RepID=UPI001405438E|nr:LysM peptidoglycan-binding domain-containing protein [Tamaricihabitans halophyticus]